MNSRPVEIKEVTKMLKKIFVDMKIPVGTANAVVSINVPPVTLDVNLEPSKLSVFIEGQERLFEALQDKARSHFGLDGDENAPPNNTSPQNQELRLEPQPALVENVQESPIVVERRLPPPEATAAPEKRRQGEAEAESSLLSDKSLSMSSSGDASFVEVSWATGQQETARANALSTVKQLSIDSWATGKAILSEGTGIPVVPVAMVVGKEPPKRSHVSASECFKEMVSISCYQPLPIISHQVQHLATGPGNFNVLFRPRKSRKYRSLTRPILGWRIFCSRWKRRKKT